MHLAKNCGKGHEDSTPGPSSQTRRGVAAWIPACAGMTDKARTGKLRLARGTHAMGNKLSILLFCMASRLRGNDDRKPKLPSPFVERGPGGEVCGSLLPSSFEGRGWGSSLRGVAGVEFA